MSASSGSKNSKKNKKKCKSTWSNAKTSAVAPMINWREVLAGSSCGRRSVTPPTATIATAENNCDFFLVILYTLVDFFYACKEFKIVLGSIMLRCKRCCCITLRVMHLAYFITFNKTLRLAQILQVMTYERIVAS